VIKNCIFWNNNNGDIADTGGGSVDVSFSDIDLAGGTVYTDLGNNTNSDPLFLNAPADDFRLLNNTSPAFDAGTIDGGSAPTDDLVGTTRTAPPDMGSYELNTASLFPLDCPTVRLVLLPVTLDYLRAACTGEDRRIYWQSRQETGMEAYLLASETEQYSIPARNFPGNYEIRLPARADDNFYVLSSRDLDGEVRVLAAVAAPHCNGEGMRISSYPTRINSELHLELDAQEAGSALVEVVDLAGRVCHREQLSLRPGLNQFTFDSTKMPPGAFLLRVIAGGTAYRQMHLR
jgi:hypothetical protein